MSIKLRLQKYKLVSCVRPPRSWKLLQSLIVSKERNLSVFIADNVSSYSNSEALRRFAGLGNSLKELWRQNAQWVRAEPSADAHASYHRRYTGILDSRFSSLVHI